eukprot:TRINITY_DN32076_c0_g1_i1.p1 TRINITY_DN32076_c0_g1~~TRINITY_DN32076_c0_g1_i1.p1  ORF type:complete len:443 (-),score=49.32 TRINITY_DN32076_c0_g1_i1:47-1318(-)
MDDELLFDGIDFTEHDEQAEKNLESAKQKAARKVQADSARVIVEEMYRNPQDGENKEELFDRCVVKLAEIAPSVQDKRTFVKSVVRFIDPPPTKRTPEEWQAIFPRYPTTEDGYVQSFEPDDAEGYRAALEKYGVCVVKVLSADECDRTVTAMFEEVNSLPPGPRKQCDVSPTDPNTWADVNWPTSSKFLTKESAMHPQAFTVRSNETIYKVFSKIWNEHRLGVSVDRWGIARGSKDVPLGDTTVDKPRWKAPLKPHWDYNPWLFVDEQATGMAMGYQGLVALLDQPVDIGAHLTLPGGTKFLKTWTEEHACIFPTRLTRKSARPKPDDPILDYMQPIPLRKGEMVIWSWGQLHGSIPNASPNMRLHQFVRMWPADAVNPEYSDHDGFSAKRVLRKCMKDPSFDIKKYNWTPFQRKLFQLDPW